MQNQDQGAANITAAALNNMSALAGAAGSSKR
jgi:hypothetical protein